VAGLAALTTAYLFYTDDEGYPKSDDSVLLTVSVFCFYTGLITALLASVSYWWMNRFFRKG